MNASRLLSGDWGSWRLGPLDVPVRGLVLAGGIALWLLVTALLTSFDDTLAAVAANVAFVAGLFVLFSLTRTIGVMTVTRSFALGALAMAIMLVLGQPLAGLSSDPKAAIDPIVEELLKLAPLALLFWQGRRIRIWQFSATDVVLITAAAGAGFAVVEDAFIRMNLGWGDTLPFLPTTEIWEDRIQGDRLVAGHAIWTALAGVTIGLAWLMARFRLALLLAPLGLVIATADHMGVNSSTNALLGGVVIVLFIAGVAGALALDLYVLRQPLPEVPELDSALARPVQPLERWSRVLDSRRLRFAAWRMQRDSTRSGDGAERAVRHSVGKLVGRGNPSA